MRNGRYRERRGILFPFQGGDLGPETAFSRIENAVCLAIVKRLLTTDRRETGLSCYVSSLCTGFVANGPLGFALAGPIRLPSLAQGRLTKAAVSTCDEVAV